MDNQIAQTGIEKTLTPEKKVAISISARYAAGGLSVTISGAAKLARACHPAWEEDQLNERRIYNSHGIRVFRALYDEGWVSSPPNRALLGSWILGAVSLAQSEDPQTFLLKAPQSIENVRQAIQSILETARTLYQTYLSTYTVTGELIEEEDKKGTVKF